MYLFADHLRSQGSVRTLQFILFLYIQQIHKISFKASLVFGGEEYPCHVMKSSFWLITNVRMGCSRKNPHPPKDGILEILTGGG